MSVGDIVQLVVVALLVLVVATIGISAHTVVKHRVPFKGILALGAAIVYVLSPVDVAPEAVLGPLGLVDDIGVFTAALAYAKRLGAIRQALRRPR